MKTLIEIVLCSFVLISCFKRSAVEGTAADLSMAGLGTFDTTSVNNSSLFTITIYNNGESPATNIQILGMSAPFDYQGGAYPGTSGTCGSSIPAHGSCTIVLEFSPLTGGSHNNTITLWYDRGDEMVSSTMYIDGTAVPQGELDTGFATSGIFELNLGANEIVKNVHIRPDGKIILVGDTDAGVGSTGDISVLRLNADGAIDTNFGTSGPGYSIIDSGSNANDVVNGSALLSSGQILICGSADNQILLSRLNINGSIDTSFGTLNGITKLTNIVLLNTEAAYDCNVQSSGKIITVGETDPLGGLPITNTQALITRLNANGTLMDVTFGTLGSKTMDFGSNKDDRAQSVAIQADDKIIVGGYTDNGTVKDSVLVKLTANGASDTTFDTDGMVVKDMCGNGLTDEIKSVIVDSTNQIVAAGYCDTAGNGRDLFVAQFNDDGSLDTSFAGTGVVKIDIAGHDDVTLKVVRQFDGKIVAAGYSNNGTKDQVLLVRLNTDGSMDTQFATGGIKTLSVGTTHSRSMGMALQSDGKIVLGGFSTNSNTDYIALRFFP